MSERWPEYGARHVLAGAILLAGLGAVLTFSRTSAKGKVDKRSATSEVALMAAGEWFAISSSPFRAPIAKGSPMRIQFRDCHAAPLTEVLNVGRSDEVARGFGVSFRVPVSVVAEIATDDRSLGSASQATIGGRLEFLRGISLHCIFLRADDGPDSGLLVGTADAVAVPVGHTIHFADQPMPKLEPAKPLRSLAFLDGHGYQFLVNAASAPQNPQGVLRCDGRWDARWDEP